MAKLRAGGQLAVEAYDRDDTAKITAGTLSSIDNQIDTTTGTYKLKATFSNENNIRYFIGKLDNFRAYIYILIC